ncbi:MAG: hypothetical protein JKY85_08360 [Porticoccus sp.]|nr:hypothetical protein [Porticoccus sp.]
MSDNLIISKIQLKTENGFNELSGFLDDDYIYFRTPEKFQLYLSAEWFVGVALLEAMASNRSIEVDSQVCISAQLLKQLKEVQAVFTCWNPDLHTVDILGKASIEDRSYSAVGSFFSAGVDSSHTLIRHMDSISHLIMLRVFDMGDDQESWDQRISEQTAFAASLGKSLVPVESNARDWLDDKQIAWGFAHGLLLSAAGTALGLKSLYIGSSHTYDNLFPWGSHVLTDPMWSTESTKVVHDGAAYRRPEKIRKILEYPDVANNLQVCWNNIHQNCGTCPKCIRSMAALYLMGANVQSLPPLQTLDDLKALTPTTQAAAANLEDLILLAKEVGDKKIYKILKKSYNKYQMGQLWSMVDKCLLGGNLRKLYRRIKKPRWLNLRVTLRSPNRGDL